MNIFILDKDPILAAQMQCDKHVVKMILESAQLLSTAHHVLDGNSAREGIYKPTHVNHPCSIWVRESVHNYEWLWKHLSALCNEYFYRYGKQHKTSSLLNTLIFFPKDLGGFYRTSFAVAMKVRPECIVEGDPVQSYRNYYKTKQKDFKMVWTKREVPSWFNEQSLKFVLTNHYEPCT